MIDPVLAVQQLAVAYRAPRGSVRALREVSLDLPRGEALALIGESGSGKTTLGLALLGLLPPSAAVTQGRIVYRGGAQAVDVLRMEPRQMRRFRWNECAMVVQGAQNAFNPVLRIADHFRDTARAHGALRGRALTARALHLLNLVRLEPERVWHAYPHELSGGMRQRVLIALSLLLDPQVLILDEPTTALDILTQRTIVDVLTTLRRALNVALIVISHDLALAAALADRVATMYAGTIVEAADTRTIFQAAAHPYTIGLLGALPTLAGPPADLTAIPGAPPDLIDLPRGCAFHPRCPLADARCRAEEPPLVSVEPEHQVACWHWQAARARRRALFGKERQHVDPADRA
ncbi:MAG TPA: ABC transporter ATP-binding protein [Herpetosiphonaceae bacterium]